MNVKNWGWHLICSQKYPQNCHYHYHPNGTWMQFCPQSSLGLPNTKKDKCHTKMSKGEQSQRKPPTSKRIWPLSKRLHKPTSGVANIGHGFQAMPAMWEGMMLFKLMAWSLVILGIQFVFCKLKGNKEYIRLPNQSCYLQFQTQTFVKCLCTYMNPKSKWLHYKRLWEEATSFLIFIDSLV